MSTVFEPQPGLKLNLDDAGGSGRAVLFQHGLCGNAAQPAEVFPDDAAWRRLTLESRGHGKSDAGELSAFSIATFADDTIAMIERSGLAPLIVGGISMGAAIALRIAVLRPDLVRGLILARPAWIAEAAPANMRPNAEVGALLARLPTDQAAQAFEKSKTARRLAVEAPDNLASLMSFFSRKPQAITAALLTAISADGPEVTRRQIEDILVPTLVIGHKQDAVHPFSMACELASLIRGAHFAHITPKAEDKSRYVRDFAEAMRIFLKEFD